MDEHERGYASGSRLEGELSTKEAARRLGASQSTVRDWARDTLAGEGRRFEVARRDPFGRYWVPAAEVDRVARSMDPDWEPTK